jgi:hypothetical protein
MKPVSLIVVTVTLVAGLLGAIPASAAADPTELRFGDLDRGAPPAVPWLDGDTLVDGSLRVAVPRRVYDVFGRSADDYLVAAAEAGGGDGDDSLLRVRPDGTRSLVLRETLLRDAELSPDGTALAHSRPDLRTLSRSTLRVFDTTTGAVMHRRGVRGDASVLDFDGSRMVVGTTTPSRTLLWDLRTDALTEVGPSTGDTADLAADRLAVFTADPYAGGCTVVSTLSAPDTALWRSCRERVTAWSADGSRMATADILPEGLGPARLWLRMADGRLIARFDPPVHFGQMRSEDGTHLLVDTYGRTKYAVVRCDGIDCQRAGRFHPSTLPDSTPEDARGQ